VIQLIYLNRWLWDLKRITKNKISKFERIRIRILKKIIMILEDIIIENYTINILEEIIIDPEEIFVIILDKITW